MGAGTSVTVAFMSLGGGELGLLFGVSLRVVALPLCTSCFCAHVPVYCAFLCIVCAFVAQILGAVQRAMGVIVTEGTPGSPPRACLRLLGDTCTRGFHCIGNAVENAPAGVCVRVRVDSCVGCR